jgi:ABC-type glutathione transport system ATPase component
VSAHQKSDLLSQKEAVLFVKRTKNFSFFALTTGCGSHRKRIDVFCFFFSKKKRFLLAFESLVETLTLLMDARPFIEARNLVRQFGGMRAVDGVSIALAPGEMVGLIGPNGAGKTTLFNLIAGSLKPHAARRPRPPA